MTPVDLPDVVRAKARAEGAEGERWLRELPETVAHLAEVWELTVGATYQDGTSGYVAAATRADGTEAALKVSAPGSIDGYDSFSSSVAVFEAAAGDACATLLAHDLERRALLLERLGPNLASLGLPVEQRHDVICATVRRLWKPAPGAPVPDGATKARWLGAYIARIWEELDRPCSERAVDTALAYAEQRAGAFDPETAVLVHGDAHQWNTLVAGPGRFKLVDPEGLLSEPAHDLAIPMREDNEDLLEGDALALGRARAQRLGARTGVDPEAIWQWGFIERLSSGLYWIELDNPAEGLPFVRIADDWSAISSR